MKNTKKLLLGLLALAPLTHADTVTYDFESGMGVSGTTAAGTTDISWNPLFTGTAGDSTRAYDSLTPANDLYLINSRDNDPKPGTYDLITPNVSYFEFSLTAAAGQRLDFSSATAKGTFAAYKDTGTYSMTYQLYVETSDNLGTWTQIGPQRSILTGAVTNSYNTGFTDSDTDAAVAGYSLTPAATTTFKATRGFTLADLGTLDDGVDAKFRLTISDTRKNNANFYSSADNILVESFTVIPEPATLGLVTAFGGGILFIRRRFLI